MDDDDRRPSVGPEDGTDEPLDPAIEQFITNLGLYFEEFGIPRIGGRMLGLLLVSPQPLAAEEMANKLKVSRASISTNINVLLVSGLAERVGIAGDRRDFYQFPHGGLELIFTTRMKAVTTLANLAEQCLTALGPAHPARGSMEELANLANFTASYLQDMLVAWREYRAAKHK